MRAIRRAPQEWLFNWKFGLSEFSAMVRRGEVPVA